MNRSRLFGRFAALPSANRTVDRPGYFRPVLEPLEERRLLTANNWFSLAWSDVDSGFDGHNLVAGQQVQVYMVDPSTLQLTLVTGSYGITGFGNVTNTDQLNIAGDATIHDAVTKMAAGGVLQIAAGTYAVSDLILNQALTIEGSGALATTLVPEVASDHTEATNFGKAGAGGNGAHQGIIINAINTTVSNLVLNGNLGGVGGSLNYHQGITTLYDLAQDGHNYYSAFDYSNPGTPIHVPLTPSPFGAGNVTVNMTVANVTVNNTFVHGIAMSSYYNTPAYKVMTVNAVQVNNVGAPADRITDSNRVGILMMNTDNSTLNGSTVTGVAVGIQTIYYGNAPTFGLPFNGPDSHCAITNNTVTDPVQIAFSETFNHGNNIYGNFQANKAYFSDPNNTGIGLYWSHSEFRLADDTIVGAKIGIQITNTTYDIQSGTGRPVAPYIDAATVIVGPGGGTIPGTPLTLPAAPNSIQSGSVGILMDNTAAEPSRVCAELGETRIYGFATGVKISQSPTQGANQPSVLILDRARISGNTVGILAGDNTQILGGGQNVSDPITLTGSATINPSWSNPPLATQPVRVVNGTQNQSPVNTPPTADVLSSGNLTLSSTSTFAPLLTGQSGTTQLFDFNAIPAGTGGTGIYPTAAADTPIPVPPAAVGPPYETDTPLGAYVGFWANDATQDGTGQLVLHNTAVNGSGTAYLFGGNYHADGNHPGFYITDPTDLSGQTTLNVAIKALSDNQSPVWGFGLVDIRGNSNVWTFDSLTMSTSTFSTVTVNLLAPSARVAGPDTTIDLQHISGWLVTSDNASLTGGVSNTPFRFSFDNVNATSVVNGQISVNSSIALAGTLSPTLSAALTATPPSIGTSFTLIKNNSGSAVSGSFSNAPDGSFMKINGLTYQVSYNGNAEHDVTLTRVAEPPPAGPEFRVNTYTTSSQTFPVVASDAAGDYVVVWQSNGQDGSGYGVYAQRYNDAGAAQGGEFRVNNYTTNAQSHPTVAMDTAGDFVVAWSSSGQDGSNYGVYAQRYNAAGMAQGGEFRVNSYTTSAQAHPTVAMDTAGDFVVAWSSSGQDGSGYGVYAQRYNAAGTAQGGEFHVSTYTTSNQRDASVAMDAAGDFIVAWSSYNQDGSFSGIYAQRFNSAGVAQGVEFRVNTYTTNPQLLPTVAMDTGGDFVVTWESNGQDGSEYGVFAQRYNAAGVTQGSEFRVNTYTTSSQFTPAVVMDASGDFVVAWSSYLQDGGSGLGWGVFAQRYNAAGVTQGSEFRINTYTTSSQSTPGVAMDASGDFVVAWQSIDQDGSGYGIYAQGYIDTTAPAVTALKSQTGEAVQPGGSFLNQVTSLVVQFSKNMTTAGGAGGAASVTNPANYQLLRGATDISGTITGVTYAFNPASGHFEATLALSAPLPTSSYQFTARRSLQATNSDSLNGGSDFVLSFSVPSVIGIGSEFRVNTYTTANEAHPAVASDAAGDYVVAWDSSGQDGSGSGIYAQRYNAAGVAQGSEFRVNTYTTADQDAPSVAMDSAGDFVVAWRSYGQDGSGSGVYAQRYNAAGVAQGSEFKVNTYTTNSQGLPSVAMDSAGDFVVAWESSGQDGSAEGVYAQRYNAAGVAQGSEFQVNTYTTSHQYLPLVAMDSAGDFVVAWRSYGQDGSGYGVYAQRYNATGVAQGSEFQVNTYTTTNQDARSVAMDSAGDFVVAWRSNGQDGSGYGVYAQRYNAAGVAQGSEFRVNTYTTNVQELPSVAMDSAGDFVVAWQSNGQDGSGYGVYAQRYNAAGVTQGAEFQVNTFTTNDQRLPSVAMDSAGDFVVAWHSYGQDGSGYGIYAQRYQVQLPVVDLNGAAAGLNFATLFIVGTGPVAIEDPTATLTDADSSNLASLTATLASPHTGDVLAANTSGTSITANFNGTNLVLSGTDTVAHYQQVLRTVTYNNTAGGPGVASETVNFTVVDPLNGLSNVAVATVAIDLPPVVDLNGAAAGTGFSPTWAGSVLPIEDSTATLADVDSSNLASLTVSLASPRTGDVLAANVSGTSIAANFNGTNLVLSGADTVAHYQQVLRTVTYNNALGGPNVATETVNFKAVDPLGALSNVAVATITIAPVIIDLNGAAAGTGFNPTWHGTAVAIEDPTATLTDPSASNLASLTVSLASPHTGDVLAANVSGTSISANFNGTHLVLSGADTLAHYQQVLLSITYDNTASGPGVDSEIVNFTAVDSLSGLSNVAVSTISFPAVQPIQTIGDGGNANVGNFSTSGGIGFFTANDGSTGTELWKTDGTSGGTSLVKDINPLSASSNPSNLTDVNGTSFFTANDGTHGYELWKSDGTAGGTVLVKDIRPGNVNSNPTNFMNVNGTLFFQANDGSGGDELWKSDGTATGTVLVKDISSGITSSSPSLLTNVNGKLFFIASEAADGVELWTSNGTAAGTVLVKDINPGSSSSNPGSLTDVSGTLFFTADDGSHGVELWKSDGTAVGTVLVKDINPGISSSNPGSLTNVSGTLFFTADDGSHGVELWKSDGTAVGTVLVQNINSGGGSSNPGSATNVNGSAGSSQEGTGSDPTQLTNVNGTLFFSANDGTHGTELWTSDGTVTGTALVQDINPGTAGSDPNQLTNVNGNLFFAANHGVASSELWQSNGAAAGTILVEDLAPQTAGSSLGNLTDLNGTLLFVANSATAGAQVFAAQAAQSFEVDIGGGGSTVYVAAWRGSAVPIEDPGSAIVDTTNGNLSSLSVTLGRPQEGDVLSADTSNTPNISQFWNNLDTLELDGLVPQGSPASDFLKVLKTITYNNTAGGPEDRTAPELVTFAALDADNVSLNSATATIKFMALDLNGNNAAGTGFTTTWNGLAATAVEAPAATVTDPDPANSNLDLNLASLTVSLSSHTGDVLTANTSGTAISQSWNGTNLVLTGTDTAADYQQVLRTIQYNNTAGGPGVASETVNFRAVDPTQVTCTATATINVAVIPSAVTNRFVFYKGSPRYDVVGGLRGPLPFSDDNAIASDKSAYLPNSTTATFGNVTGYSKGINGIMVDLKGGGAHTSITLANILNDFTFKVGNNNSPNTWALAPNPSSITVRTNMDPANNGAGTVSGSDRVELMWADGAITKQFLEVTVKATTRTGLTANDVFMYGNEIGDTGLNDTALVDKVDAVDVGGIQSHGANNASNIAISNVFDLDKNGKVDSIDVSFAQANGTNNATGLHLLALSSNGPFAPDAAAAPAASGDAGVASPLAITSLSASGTATIAAFPSWIANHLEAPAAAATPAASGDVGVASALASMSPSASGTAPIAAIPSWIVNRLEHADLNHGPIAKYFEHLAHENTAKAKTILVEADQIADALGLDDELLDELVAGLKL